MLIGKGISLVDLDKHLLVEIQMSTKILYIQSKQRPDPLSIVKLQDFDYIEGENIDPKTIIESLNISLYCLDPQNQQAIFVETPLDIKLSNAPFFH